jgi:5-formyltetrahydrofolate cyclo-ligase
MRSMVEGQAQQVQRPEVSRSRLCPSTSLRLVPLPVPGRIELSTWLVVTAKRPCVTDKATLRQKLRAARRAHVAALDPATRALILHRPPAPLLTLVPEGASIGLYHAGPHEAPAAGYARFFHERGHALALPRFAHRGAAMDFADWTDPWDASDCEVGPFGLMQPAATARSVAPEVLFVPLLGFTADGGRLGQGGGHYDRWLAAHPDTVAIGLAWDVQLVESLTVEPHDRPLAAIVTPTRLYGPFA